MQPELTSLSAAELDALIASAVAERAKREPQVTMEQPKTIEAIIDPRWFVFPVGENSVVQIRHPGHGWLGFMFPPASRAQLLSLFLQHALMPVIKAEIITAAPPPAAGGGKMH